MKKKLNLNGQRINLAIWDTAGQERFHALGPIYYRMSNGAILVYDITDEDSFQKVIFIVDSKISVNILHSHIKLTLFLGSKFNKISVSMNSLDKLSINDS